VRGQGVRERLERSRRSWDRGEKQNREVSRQRMADSKLLTEETHVRPGTRDWTVKKGGSLFRVDLIKDLMLHGDECRQEKTTD